MSVAPCAHILAATSQNSTLYSLGRPGPGDTAGLVSSCPSAPSMVPRGTLMNGSAHAYDSRLSTVRVRYLRPVRLRSERGGSRARPRQQSMGVIVQARGVRLEEGMRRSTSLASKPHRPKVSNAHGGK